MDESRKQFAENDNLVDRLHGMASYLADKGAVKAPDLLKEAAREIRELRKSIGAIRKLNNGMWRWTSCMSYNESYVGEPGEHSGRCAGRSQPPDGFCRGQSG